MLFPLFGGASPPAANHDVALRIGAASKIASTLFTVSVSVTGVAAAFSVGTPTIQVTDPNDVLVRVGDNSEVVAPTFPYTNVSPTGVEGVFAVGVPTVLDIVETAPSGVAATFAVGTTTQETDVPAAGQVGTFAVGTVSVEAGSDLDVLVRVGDDSEVLSPAAPYTNVSPSGVAGTFAVGSPTVSTETTVHDVVFRIGSASKVSSTAFTVTVSPAGLAGTLALGIPVVVCETAPAGLAVAGTLGTAAVECVVEPAGLEGTFAVGSPTVEAEELKDVIVRVGDDSEIIAPSIPYVLAGGVAGTFAVGTVSIEGDAISGAVVEPVGLSLTISLTSGIETDIDYVPDGVSATFAVGSHPLHLHEVSDSLVATFAVGAPTIVTEAFNDVVLRVGASSRVSAPQFTLSAAPAGVVGTFAVGNVSIEGDASSNDANVFPTGLVLSVSLGAPGVEAPVYPAGLSAAFSVGTVAILSEIHDVVLRIGSLSHIQGTQFTGSQHATVNATGVSATVIVDVIIGQADSTLTPAPVTGTVTLGAVDSQTIVSGAALQSLGPLSSAVGVPGFETIEEVAGVSATFDVGSVTIVLDSSPSEVEIIPPGLALSIALGQDAKVAEVFPAGLEITSALGEDVKESIHNSESFALSIQLGTPALFVISPDAEPAGLELTVSLGVPDIITQEPISGLVATFAVGSPVIDITNLEVAVIGLEILAEVGSVQIAGDAGQIIPVLVDGVEAQFGVSSICYIMIYEDEIVDSTTLNSEDSVNTTYTVESIDPTSTTPEGCP